MRFRTIVMCAALVCLSSSASAGFTQLLVGFGAAGFLDETQTGYGSVELRRFFYTWNKLSIAGGGGVEIGGSDQYVGGVLTVDYPFHHRFGITLSTGPGYYTNSEVNLGDHFEFRSGLEVYATLQQGLRIGLGMFHFSNGGLSETNPGSNAIRFAVTIPLPW